MNNNLNSVTNIENTDLRTNIQKFELARKLLEQDYDLLDISKMVGLSLDELELYLSSLEYDGDVLDLVSDSTKNSNIK